MILCLCCSMANKKKTINVPGKRSQKGTLILSGKYIFSCSVLYSFVKLWINQSMVPKKHVPFFG